MTCDRGDCIDFIDEKEINRNKIMKKAEKIWI